MDYDLTNRNLHASNLASIAMDYYQQKDEWKKELSAKGIKAFHCGNGISDTPNKIPYGLEPTGSPSLLADIIPGDKIALGYHGEYRLVEVTGVSRGYDISICYKELK